MKDHALALGHGVERARPLAGPDQVGIALVLEDHDAVLGGDLQQLGAARLAHDGAGRVLHRRDGVDVLGLDALLLQLLELLLQHVEPQPLVVERNADRVDAELGQLGERAAVGLLLDQDGVALGDQQAVDQVEALHRARGDQDLVGRAVDAGMALELAGQELAQRPVAERAAVQAVGRERGALALQHRRRRGDQGVDRHVLGVVVAADEIVLGEAVPLDGGRAACRAPASGAKSNGAVMAFPRAFLGPNCWAKIRRFATGLAIPFLPGKREGHGSRGHAAAKRSAAIRPSPRTNGVRQVPGRRQRGCPAGTSSPSASEG